MNNWALIFKACLGVRRHCNGKYVSLAIKKNKVCVVNLHAAIFGEQIKGSRVLDKKVNETQVSTTAFCRLNSIAFLNGTTVVLLKNIPRIS